MLAYQCLVSILVGHHENKMGGRKLEEFLLSLQPLKSFRSERWQLYFPFPNFHF